MTKLNYLFLTICMLAIGTWSHAQCTGSGGILINNGDDIVCEGQATNIILATASAPAQGDVSGYSWVITDADISMTNDPLNSTALVAGLPITDEALVTLEAVLSDYVSSNGTYYITSVAFGNGTWTGMSMETIADVTLDPDCTFTSASMAIEFGGASCPPSYDMCANAVDLTSSLGQGTTPVTTGPYDNTNATVNADESEAGLDDGCFGEPGYDAPVILNNPIWFKITGDGNPYHIRASHTECSSTTNPIEDNDTQIAIYTGSCDDQTLIACNEDSPEATGGNYFSDLILETEDGVEYLILVDGFDCSSPSACGGVVSAGEFCITITQQSTVACSEGSVGAVSALQDVLCLPDDTIAIFTVSESLAPTDGEVAGYYWAFSTLDLGGTTDLANAPGFLGGFPIASTLADTVGLNFPLNGLTPGSYFATLYAFGNGVIDNGNLVLDPSCTYVSNSHQVNYYEASEEICIVGTLDVDEEVLGMTIFPNPVQDVVNLNINTAEYSEAIIMITNVTGQTIKQQVVNLQSGANVFNIDLDSAPAGVYMISVETDSHQSVSRFMKQ